MIIALVVSLFIYYSFNKWSDDQKDLSMVEKGYEQVVEEGHVVWKKVK